jgi:hypothetical protein
MKRINLFFLGLFLLVGFFGVIGLAQAGCCVGSGGSCVVGATSASCIDSIYHADSCSVLPECATTDPGGTTATTATTSGSFENPLKIKTVNELLTSLLKNLRSLIVVIAVIFMVIGGIMYMVSGGNENMVKRAKQTWTGAIVGLAIALAAPAFLNEIISILQAKDLGDTGSTITIKQIAVNVLNFLLSIVGVLGIISLVIGGGMYLTAYGDEKRIDSGKKMITYAIIGIIVALGALVVVRQVASLINVG